MLEKRIWPNLAYVFLFLLLCLTLWQITLSPHHFPTVTELSTATVYTLYSSNWSYSPPIHTLPASDYHQLIDLDFSFKMLNLVCNDSSPLLLVLVHSSPYNALKRRIIRETWGRSSRQVKIVFMIGETNYEDWINYLQYESEHFGDMVQGGFNDTYRNITYKHVMTLKYAIYHCPQAKYILKTDDDVFVNMPALVNFITTDLSPYGAARLLYCTPRRDKMALRTYRSKWRVSFKEYPKKKYPTYCPGWILLYSPDVIFDLYTEAQRSSYFWIDDVHITGTLAKRIHLIHSNIEPLVLSIENQKGIIDSFANVSQLFLFGRPNVKKEDIAILWEYVKAHDVPKTLIKQLETSG